MHSCSPPLGGPMTFPLDLRVQVPPLEMETSGIGQSSEGCVFISQLSGVSGVSALGLKGMSGSLTTTPEPVLMPLNPGPAGPWLGAHRLELPVVDLVQGAPAYCPACVLTEPLSHFNPGGEDLISVQGELQTLTPSALSTVL